MKDNLLKFKNFFFGLSLLAIPSLAYATEANHDDITSKMTLLVFQISVIIFTAWAGGFIFTKIKLPSVLGEICAGIIIGPYCLGHLPFASFDAGLFPITNPTFPISPELYAFSTLAVIILLFLSGLETNLKTFIKYSATASVIGIFEVIMSFFLGNLLGIIFAKYVLYQSCTFIDPIPLFTGLIAVATSVSISARILTENKKMDSPEGVTILAAALFDDILGIVFLTIIIGIVKSGHVVWEDLIYIGLKSIMIGLIFTILGLTFAYKISGFLKTFKDRTTITVIAFALALFLAGLFEKSGLTMIIGAYIMGLSLSKTDVSLIIRENFAPIQKLFVPMFFCIVGMLFDVTQLASVSIIIIGTLYCIFAALGKILGCGIPALFLNFNKIGALRIGFGLIPRGEVTLIIAGIGLSAGLIPKEIFSISIIMTFGTILLTPLILPKLLAVPVSGIRKETKDKTEINKEITYTLPNAETAALILTKVIEAFENEGFYVHLMDINDQLYQIRKNEMIITLKASSNELFFDCKERTAPFIHTLFYEVVAEMEYLMKHLKNLTDKEDIGKKIFDIDDNNVTQKERITNLKDIISPLAITTNLHGNTKKEIICELVDTLIKAGQLKYEMRDEVINDLLAREEIMSTGLQDGVAFPHTKISSIDTIVAAIGIKKDGVDFDSLDNKPSNIFILTLAPKDSPKPYLQFLAELTKILTNQDTRTKILNATNYKQIYTLFVGE